MDEVRFFGNIGRDAEVKHVRNRIAINFSVCVNKRAQDPNGQWVDKDPRWYSCTLWKDPAQNMDISNHLVKGTKVYVEGNYDVTFYKDKEGRPAAAYNVQALRIELCGVRQDKTPAGSQEELTQERADPLTKRRIPERPEPDPRTEKDDLPF